MLIKARSARGLASYKRCLRGVEPEPGQLPGAVLVLAADIAVVLAIVFDRRVEPVAEKNGPGG